MNNTLTDLKRLLDSGETLVNGDKQLWKSEAGYGYCYLDRPNHVRTSVNFEYAVKEYIKDPSLWRQRDQIGAEKQFAPRMVVVDAREWEEMNEELKRLREQVK